MQSPARARYSPLASVAASGAFCCASAAVASSDAAKVTSSFRVRGMFTLPSTRLTAAFKRHRQAPARRKGRILWRRPRGKIGSHRFHVVFGEQPGDDLHAIGRGRGTGPVTPAAEL